MTHSNAAEVALTCQIDNKIITSIPFNTLPQVTSLIQITYVLIKVGYWESKFEYYTHITSLVWAQMDMTQLDHIFPIY